MENNNPRRGRKWRNKNEGLSISFLGIFFPTPPLLIPHFYDVRIFFERLSSCTYFKLGTSDSFLAAANSFFVIDYSKKNRLELAKNVILNQFTNVTLYRNPTLWLHYLCFKLYLYICTCQRDWTMGYLFH